MSFLDAVDCKNGLIRVCVAVLHKLTTERNQRHVGSSGREFSQRSRNAQGGTTADGKGNTSAAWNGALKLRKQTAHFNIDMFCLLISEQSAKLQNQCNTWHTTIFISILKQTMFYTLSLFILVNKLLCLSY